MKKFQVIVRILMASVIMFGIETTASAQFGGLLKKAKSAVKDQVDNKAKMSKFEVKDAINQAAKGNLPSSDESSYDSNSSDDSSSDNESSSANSNLGGYKTQFDVNLSKAKHADWDYTSDGATIEADFAYWMQRLITSMASGNPDNLDWEAAGRINTGKPSFDFLDKTYHLYDGEKLTDYEAEQWQFERKAVIKRMQEIEAIGLPQSPNTDGLDKDAKAKKLGQYMVTKANAQHTTTIRSRSMYSAPPSIAPSPLRSSVKTKASACSTRYSSSRTTMAENTAETKSVQVD